MNAANFPNFRQFLLFRVKLPYDIVNYIYDFNAPREDKEKEKQQIFMIYKHLNVLKQITDGRGVVASGLFVNYRGHSIREWTGELKYADLVKARRAGADNIKYIKNHSENTPQMDYKHKFNLSVGEIKYINGSTIKKGFTPYFEDFDESKFVQYDDSDDEADRENLIHDAYIEYWPKIRNSKKRGEAPDAGPIRAILENKADFIKFNRKRLEYAFLVIETINDNTAGQETAPTMRRISRLNRAEKHQRRRYIQMLNQLRAMQRNHIEFLTRAPRLRRVPLVTYIKISMINKEL